MSYISIIQINNLGMSGDRARAAGQNRDPGTALRLARSWHGHGLGWAGPYSGCAFLVRARAGPLGPARLANYRLGPQKPLSS